jgi:hypothetical protein
MFQNIGITKNPVMPAPIAGLYPLPDSTPHIHR